MRLEAFADGYITRRSPAAKNPIAACPRVVQLAGGELLASYVVQSKLGVNDFAPMLARSSDGGATWSAEYPLWPELTARNSVFGSISISPAGELFLFGAKTPIDEPGESLWSEATQGLKQNELFWSSSPDGRTWSQPRVIPMPQPGSAEAPGPMCVTRGGHWLACYSPYHNFDPATRVDRHQVTLLRSDDKGAHWAHRPMLRFAEEDSGGAEAWVVELSDGTLLGTAWHTDLSGAAKDYPNVYSLSQDGGESWSTTRSTGIMGQTTALTPLADAKALFLHTQRKGHAPIGIWAAIVAPTPGSFGVLNHEPLWTTSAAVTGTSDAGHSEWRQFNFGEPAATVLNDGTILMCFWYIDDSSSGVRYLKLRMVESSSNAAGGQQAGPGYNPPHERGDESRRNNARQA